MFKHFQKLKRVGYFFTLATFLTVFSLALTAPLAPRAEAATIPNNVFFFPDDADAKSDLIGALRDEKIGSDDTGGILSQTKIITSGGRLGTAVLTLDSKNSDKHEVLTYKTDYYCTPTNNFELSLKKPNVDVPYIRYTLGVFLMNNLNEMSQDELKDVPNKSDYKTYMGVLGNTEVGTAHFPINRGPEGTKPAKDFGIYGSGGDNDVRTGIDMDKYGIEQPDALSYDFKMYDAAFNKSVEDAFKGCLPSSRGYITNASNFNKLSQEQKSDLNKAIQDSGQGGSVAEAGAASSDASAQTNPDCQSGGDPLNWILCPVFDGVAGITDWIFEQILQPLLTTTPLSTDPDSATYKIWSNFRIYGNIFLVIALLVIVFGQSIGGGLVDAYTAKKVLPRLVIATILINLSLYIVAALVDITNIIGGSIGALMTAPLQDAGAFKITPSGVQSGSIAGVAIGSAGIGALLFKVAPLASMSFLVHAVSFAALFIIMPAVLGMLAAFITLVLRQAVILALVLISPLAFALYCLPNTEQYFRKWWSFLWQALLVYPIIIIIFAVADILSVTLYETGPNDPLAAVISFVLQFLPLLMIPFAFRLAGGAMGRIHDVLTNYNKRGQEAVKGNSANPNSLRNRVRGKVGGDLTRSRAANFRDWNAQNADGSGKGFKGKIGKRAPRLGAFISGGALTGESLLTQKAKAEINAIKDNGDDSVVNARASWVDDQGKRWTLDNKPVTEMEYRAAMQQHPTLGHMQAVAEYRAGKVTSTEQGEEFIRNYATMAQQQGLDINETNGAFIGFSFGKQNEFGHLKYGAFSQSATDGGYVYHPVGDAKSFEAEVGGVKTTTGRDGSKAAAYVQENYSNRGGYPAGMQHAEFHNAMSDTKAGYLKVLEGFEARGGTGPMTQDEKYAYDKVKQIREMERTWEFGGQVQDPNNPGQTIPTGKGQLSGASPATDAAFQRLKSVGENTTVLDRIDDDLDNDHTYEAEHSPAPGDFSPGSRATH